MSKRKGDYITVEDLIDEVGKDATRFIMLNRSSDAEIDFDFDKVKEKSKDNPLYYVQYCYARICSVFRHIGKEIDKDIKVDNLQTLLDGFRLVGDYLDKTILRPNNLSHPFNRIQFLNTLK
jgi:arginyl-tRNA synthetase